MARKTLLDLANEVEGLGLIVKLRSRELTKFVALRMLEYLVDVTPVDTSQALSNWRVAVAGTGYGALPIPAYVPGEGGSTKEASAQAAIAAGRAALKGAVVGKPIAIINVVPYIGRLNEGSSQQAPAGFVERSLIVGKAATREYNFNQRLKQDIRRGKVVPDG